MRNQKSVLLATGVLLLVAVGAFGVQLWRRQSQRTAARVLLLGDVETEVGKASPDQGELGKLRLLLLREGDHESDPGLILALARIERARGHDQQAFDLLAPAVDHGQPSVAELREAGQALQRLFAHGGDRAHARQAQVLAERAYAVSHDAADLFAAWQAAFRGEADEDRERLCKALLDGHQGSLPARLVQALLDAEHADDAALEALAGEFAAPPLELRLLRAGRLVGTDALAAMRNLEQLATEAPAVVAVRHLAACACIAYLQGAAGLAEADRTRAHTQLDAHLQWLLKNAPDTDARRPQWQKWLTGQ